MTTENCDTTNSISGKFIILDSLCQPKFEEITTDSKGNINSFLMNIGNSYVRLIADPDVNFSLTSESGNTVYTLEYLDNGHNVVITVIHIVSGVPSAFYGNWTDKNLVMPTENMLLFPPFGDTANFYDGDNNILVQFTGTSIIVSNTTDNWKFDSSTGLVTTL